MANTYTFTFYTPTCAPSYAKPPWWAPWRKPEIKRACGSWTKSVVHGLQQQHIDFLRSSVGRDIFAATHPHAALMRIEQDAPGGFVEDYVTNTTLTYSSQTP